METMERKASYLLPNLFPLVLGLAALGIIVPGAPAQAPERVILFHIDALHPDAPRRLGLRNILDLAERGTSVAEAITITPWHPTTGPYGKTHTTSLANPVTLAGTLFLRPGQKMLQHCFYPDRLTAHIANSTAYESLNPGFHYVALDRTNSDADVVRLALDLLERKDVRFMRVLLQELNNRASYLVATTTEPVPWRRNIWARGSPYIEKAREADRLLGEFLAGLERLGKREGTLLVLVSDGQADAGWHPVLSEESWRIPLVFVGPGIARGRVIPYAESIDIAPTICHLAGAPPPNPGPGAGRVLREILEDEPVPPEPRRRRLLALNTLIKEHLVLRARMRVAAAEDPCADIALMQAENAYATKYQFFGLERIMEWHEAGSIDDMIRINGAALDFLRDAFARCRAR